MLVVGMVGSLVAGAQPAEASDTITRWESFSESSGCATPYTKTPYVSKTGRLNRSELILGPMATYFGRSVGEVRDNLVWWRVPFSGGRRVQVHRLALPAFESVADRLQEEASRGRVYRITWVAAFVPRTIGGKRQLSRHALGLSIDINPRQNPHSTERLITNMPDWFVDIWRESGFCWGGDWLEEWDAMHFSWIGPGAEDISPDLTPIPPETTRVSFGKAIDWILSPLAPVRSRYDLMVGDATGNAAPDVVGLRSHPGGAVLDVASSSHHYDQCSIERWFIPDSSVLHADESLLLDTDGDSRMDLVTLHVEESGVQARVATRGGRFKDVTTTASGLDPGFTAVTGADFDGDHLADLWAAYPDGTLKVYAGPLWTRVLHTSRLPSGGPTALAAGDLDGGDMPEIFALYPDGARSEVQVLTESAGWVQVDSVDLPEIPNRYAALGALDYDGDGRSDLQVLDQSARIRTYIGNSPTGRAPSSWFVDPDPDCENPTSLVYEGSFFDDDSSAHREAIELIAGGGSPLGCNPPFNDRFCPELELTRADAVALIAGAFGVRPSKVVDAGCGPWLICPDSVISRAEFALLVAEAGFDAQIEYAVGLISEAGITTECGPPVSPQACPQRPLTRAEAAYFLHRLLG